ncbi:hypothetical protein KIN20_024974 [Parelaphostrongylus tenuis]|uniref:Lipid droplet-associated hydrolase n=1 Tax=Parelaphostrongylus tenuis TaxID=148309 RepID=A0AAD5MUC5_PARTN|nr:hypothetical protein KIN20_024974 [Parelaphostrongylus tenuis]
MDGSKNLNLRFACLYLSNGTSLWQDHRRIQQKKSYSLRQGEGKIVHEHDARVFIKPHYSNTRMLYEINRLVDWVLVGGRWTRVSVIGTDLFNETLEEISCLWFAFASRFPDDFNVKKAIALFPTIERMAETPNGARLKRVLAVLNTNDWLAKMASFWLDYLPELVKKWLVSWNLSSEAVPSDVIISATELLSMNVFRNIIHLSHDELNKELLYFYYGRADGWCPEDFGYRMAERLPRGHVILDEDGCEHAFVIRDSAIIAEKLLQFIK